MASFLTEAARDQVAAMDADCPYAKELSKIEADEVLRAEIERICAAATLGEIMKVGLLASQLKKTSGDNHQEIKSNLKEMADELLNRVEAESGPLRLPSNYRQLLFDL